MRVVYIVFFLLMNIAATAQQLQFKTVGELRQFLSYSGNRIPLISAHRGGPEKGFPENAIETFRNSSGFQPVIIECDISVSKDSVLMLMHDNKLERTSTGQGPLRDFTSAELKKLWLKDNNGDTTSFRIPTLDEALIWGKGKVIYTLDVKRGTPYRMVVESVRRCKAEAFVVVITYSADQAAEVYRLAPDLMISASIRGKEDLERLQAMGVRKDRLVAFIGTSEADEAVCRLLHENGIQCILGTMGNLDRQAMAKGDKVYCNFIERGADILSTDRPKEAGAMLKEFIKDHNLHSKHVR